MLGYSDLASFYKMNFALAQHHKWDVQSIEQLIPFERDVYVDMLIEFLEKEKDND